MNYNLKVNKSSGISVIFNIKDIKKKLVLSLIFQTIKYWNHIFSALKYQTSDENLVFPSEIYDTIFEQRRKLLLRLIRIHLAKTKPIYTKAFKTTIYSAMPNFKQRMFISY